MNVKQEKYTVEDEVVPVVLHDGAYGTYTIQTFQPSQEVAAAVATLEANHLHQIREIDSEQQIIHLNEGDCVEIATVTNATPSGPSGVASIMSDTSYHSDNSAEYSMVPETSRAKTYYCPNCGNCYSAAGSLKLHIRACTREKETSSNDSRKCEICQRTFNSSTYLREHMLRHSGKGPKKCPKCYRKFIDDTKYEAHLETHKLEERIAIEAGNPINADGAPSEKKIIKEYVCSFCSKNFTVVFDSRHTKRRYACDECREKFSNEEMLKQHKAQLEEKREFRCEKCGRKFVFEGFLQRHIPSCDGTIRRRRDRQ
ncbi:zinc finger protein 682 [Eupeodes corollae]|uniref:zinc finger protein 682 n=1 Tax=Eupeodes corollae TaxID=290404 RepID=UPI0024938156|nr:zinc finger protein 682 [Eupeodes corollae]